MPKSVTFKKGAASVLIWSVIAAAFIGPGTVTTAATAGELFQLDLVWALLFATVSCIVLQEAAARITIGSGFTLGEAISLRFGKNKIKVWLALSVIFGCAAYEAGNMLGAVSGLKLIFNLPAVYSTTAIFLFCGILLWYGTGRILFHFLGIIVALMGILFISAASGIGYSFMDVLMASFQPSFPQGSGLITIGLIGTTIVPYNLFLGSSISKNQSVREMRIGITIAVLIGGFISLSILVAGTAISGMMSFDVLTEALISMKGKYAGTLFGLGLFAAGITSALTAPLASAITGKTLLSNPNRNWSENSVAYRLTWGIVLATGFLFGISNLEPIPVIILAQAINGFLLPFVAVFLLLIVNDKKLMTPETLNKTWLNVMTLLIVLVTIFLGLNNVAKAIIQTFIPELEHRNYLILIGLLALSITIWVGNKIMLQRKNIKNPGER